MSQVFVSGRPNIHSSIDVGCGSGVLGLYLARIADCEYVYMTDIRLRAASLSLRNVELNWRPKDSRFIVCCADLFSAFNEALRFDVIVANLPLNGEQPNSRAREKWGELIHALYDPQHQVLRRFARDLPDRLGDGGFAFIPFSRELLDERDLAELFSKSTLKLRNLFHWTFMTSAPTDPLVVTKEYGCAVLTRL